MCITPRTVFQRIEGHFRPYVVACRNCWQCRQNRIWDWVGRSIAENETATKTLFVTLTYGNTNRYGEVLTDRARSLHYEDVQKWLKRIRKKHVVRYIVTGEYGPLKGRAHWHALLFFYGPAPDVKLDFDYWGNRDFNSDPFWKDGKTRYAKFEPARAKYVCKYMLKAGDGNDSLERKAMLSKKPPLGHEYFMRRAEQHVRQGLPIRDLTYHFPEVTWGKKNPKPRTYVLQGVSGENFISHYIETWRRIHGSDSWPYSELVEEYLDREAALDADTVRLERELSRPARETHSLEMPWYVPEQEQSFPTVKPCELTVDRRLNLWACSDPSMPWRAPRYWSFDENGFSGWHEVPNLVTEAKAKNLREAYALLLNPPESSFDRKAGRVPRPGKAFPQ